MLQTGTTSLVTNKASTPPKKELQSPKEINSFGFIQVLLIYSFKSQWMILDPSLIQIKTDKTINKIKINENSCRQRRYRRKRH